MRLVKGLHDLSDGFVPNVIVKSDGFVPNVIVKIEIEG